MKVLINSGFARRLTLRPTNIAKTDDAASTIRQYVAALSPANSGYFRLLSGSFRKAKLAGATVVASN
jgi:hypothetical protein